ncbi:MAG: pyruvate ferredoxin oxidoreductase [Rhodospirillaceae bacterium]|jgi:indolepyruvate ferredoxin oxidoreductase beta subunit|nr:pyruvate ferredoxin oxidoreductase [Rhodospirillaceae bacterium]MDP6620643.1 2-oxoacid:acceptor oxidoreductase family protein [Alphaproteobacteria bacterium]
MSQAEPLSQDQAAAVDPATATTRNVLVVGVGGQGVIMISKVLALVCQMQGYSVKQSEVHGMAKRGGSVFSHVRYGGQVWSPTIPQGEADVLLALEWAEGLRWLPHLRPENGVFISDTQQVVPPFACRNRSIGAELAYAKETPAEIVERVTEGYALAAGRMADEIGNSRAANTILLGSLSTTFDFPLEDWRKVIGMFVPKGTEDVNIEAFELGRKWIEEARANPERATDPAPPAPHLSAAPVEVELEITEAWCKGCDICVKLCPERCLVLDTRQVAKLTDPKACTGCRICEWLCPDFAIAVKHREPVAA